ncbi:hypothetical protein I4F81_012496 [Pyropia yezoensis]|uniref:Uncharacterized protein n=1 Tax=Pyropia yezoensis TaxID=2788 RepID=A0ACC3CJM5_PYRYE|nr:hypothetical protein I4F81_012496 [Neopyropia yezoensis]
MAFVGAAAAFRASAPARPATSAFTGTRVSAAVSRRTTGPVMSLDPVVASISNSLVTLGAADGDFGGYTGPVAGLVIIGVIIALLTPPVKE